MRTKSSNHAEHRNISISALLPYMLRFPASAWVSLLHRGSGALMFLLLPAIIWIFETSLSSRDSYLELVRIFDDGLWYAPGWLLKAATLLVFWAYLHHMMAGIRFLILDVNHASVDKQRSGRSARWVLVISLAVTLLFGAKLFLGS